MRRILVVSCLVYLSVAIVVGIHAVIFQDNGQDDNVISHDVLDRAIRWPIRIFD